MPIVSPPRPVHSFLVDATYALGMTQAQLGAALGVSHRTVARWSARESSPGALELNRLAKLLLPVDRALASEAASHTGDTLESLGLVAPPPPPPPAKPAAPPKDLVDVVLCAVANEMNVAPSAIRNLVYIAFKRAREVGLTVEAAETALAPPAGTAKAPRAPRNS